MICEGDVPVMGSLASGPTRIVVNPREVRVLLTVGRVSGTTAAGGNRLHTQPGESVIQATGSNGKLAKIYDFFFFCERYCSDHLETM